MSNLQKDIDAKNKQNIQDKKNEEKEKSRQKKQDLFNAVKHYISEGKEVVKDSFNEVKQHVQDSFDQIKIKQEELKEAEERYKQYLSFADSNNNLPMQFTNENGENVTVIQTENGPIFKTEHKIPKPSNNVSEREHQFERHLDSIVTYEGFTSVEINGISQLIYSCLTNKQTCSFCWGQGGMEDEPSSNEISGFIRSKNGQFKIIDTPQFFGDGKKVWDTYSNESYRQAEYNKKMLNIFLSIQKTFNKQLANINLNSENQNETEVM